MTRRIAGSSLSSASLVWAIVLIVIFPLIWMVITSVKPQTELFRIPPTFWPTEITFEHYRDAAGKDAPS